MSQNYPPLPEFGKHLGTHYGVRLEDAYDRKDRLGGPFAESLGLHLAIVGGLVLSVWLHGRFHGNEWGQNAGAGAIQATLVSSAPSIPLPQVQKPTDNVLATENPSPAPAIDQQKPAPVPDLKAIPIAAKQPEKPKPLPPKPQPQQQPHPQPQQQPQHRANFGEQAPSALPRSTAGSTGAPNAVAVQGGTGFRFPWYVDVITRKVRENWYIQEVDPSTPKGQQVVVTFILARDGSPSGIQIAQSSGSSSLDTSAMRAVQRVESFGPLPPGYNGSTLSVAYTFTYDQNGR
jgi:periplasmic protein TonB